jgi:hypothetical protein
MINRKIIGIRLPNNYSLKLKKNFLEVQSNVDKDGIIPLILTKNSKNRINYKWKLDNLLRFNFD